jgi:glycerol-3-phosphate acyltransferase PlsY
VSVLVLAASYLLGSIPFSFVVARRFGVGDVRKVGSGNVGATNVMRSAGKGPGLLALVLDAGKGAVAALLARRLSGDDALLPALAAAAACLGHMWPVWLGFRGGKGVATGAGAFLPLAPAATGVALVVFGVTLALTRYVSLGSIAGAVALPLFALVFGAPLPVVWTGAALAALIAFKHRGNLERIAKGTESRLGPKPADR